MTALGKAEVIRILQVDDDPSILDVSKQILMTMGNFEIDHANNAGEAFKKIEHEKYDAIVSDFEMPQKDGIQFLKELREQKNEIPFILFTGKGREEIAIQALNLGANRYINKQGNAETVYTELASSITQTVNHSKTQRLLQQTKERLALLADATFEGIGFSEEGIITDANNQLGNMLGYDPSELFGLKVFDLLAPESRGFIQDKIRSGAEGPYECLIIKKDGSVLPAEIRAQNISRQGKKGRICAIRDLSEHKKAEEVLRSSEKKFRDLFESIPDGIIITDAKGAVESANPAAATMFGYAPGELLKVPAVTLYADSQDRGVLFAVLAKHGYVKDYEVKLKRKNGSTFDANITVTIKKDLDGKTLQAKTIIRDITEHKKANSDLKASNKILEQVGESVDAGLAIIDRDYHVVWANKRLMDLGVASNKKCYQTFNKLEEICPDCGVKKVFEQNIPLDVHEYKTVNAKGETIWVELRVTPLKDPNGVPTSALELAVPITERKKTDTNLKQSQEKMINSEEKYQALFVNMPDGFAYCKMIYDQTGKPIDFIYLEVNEAFTKLTGLKKEVVVGKKVTEAIPGIEKTNPELFEIYGRVSSTGKEETFEVFLETLKIWLSINAYSPKRGYFAAIFENINQRKTFEHEITLNKTYLESILNTILSGIIVVDAKTHEIVDVNSHALTLIGATRAQVVGQVCNKFVCPAEKGKCPATDLGQEILNSERVLLALNGDRIPIIKSVIRLETDETTYLIENFVDISEVKKAETQLKESNRRIEVMNEKLYANGRLVRHDVRNKMTVITGNTYLLKKKYPNQPDILAALSKIEQSVKDSVEIFEFARMYEQLGVEEQKYINVEKTFTAAIALCTGLTFKIVNDCHQLTVLADSLLRQLFYNLIENTIKYGEKTTIARVFCEKTETGELKLIYEDDGVGVPAENKPKLFTEGFTTGKSTGFGLFLIKKMMEVYGWTIQETGEPGKGAKFTITIPNLNKDGQANFQIIT